MLLQVYNKAHVRIGVVECIGLTIESDLSKFDKTLSFSININNADLLELEGYLRTKYDEFVIKEKNYSDGYYNIVAVLNLEELEGKAFEDFDSTEQTIEKCVDTALAGTGWIVNECTVTKKRTVRATFISALDIIKQALKTYLCELQFDTINKKINIYEKIGNDKGEYLMDTVNAKKIDTQEDTYDYFTKLIAVGATKDDGTSLTCTVTNNSYSDKEKTCYWKDERYTVLENLQADAQIKLDSMAQPHIAYSVELAKLGDVSIGDTITLISKDTKTRLKTRIVKLTEYPDEPYNNTCEVNSSIYSFEDIQQQQQDVNSTVDNITSDNGTISERALSDNVIDKIFARSVIAQKITAIEADIGTLNATKANITELNAVTARVGSLEANSATINDLQAATARIGVLETGYGQIQVLQTDIASINTLLAGNVTAGSTQTIVLNANNTTIANALIKSAMIESINADKINAGSINTDNVTIKSSSGGIQIADNTMQFKDSNSNVRIQMGQDTSGNFSFIIKAEDGATTLIDGTGVKEKAIADKLIKTNMINDKAITGVKIDWDDFFTTINADGTHTLNSSKVKLNSSNQTLDVAFNQIKEKVIGNNLMVNGGFSSGDTLWNTNGNSIQIKKCDNAISGYECYINAIAGNHGLYRRVGCASGVATISFYAKLAEGTEKQTLRWGIENIKTTQSVLTEEWKRFSITIGLPRKDFGNGTMIIYSCIAGDYEVHSVKVEEGAFITDWCYNTKDTDKKIIANTTAISVQQGKIDSLVSTTTQTSDKVSTLESNYSDIRQTVGDITSTVNSHTTSISNLQTSVKDNTSVIQQTQNSITQKVWSTDITSAIDNISIGGENLMTNSGFDKGLAGWNSNGNVNGKVIEDSSIPSGYYLQMTPPNMNNGYYKSGHTSRSNKTTISFFAKVDTNGKRIIIGMENVDTRVIALTTEWKKYSFTINKSFSRATFIMYAETKGTYCMHSIKVEDGTKVTDWSLSQRDILSYTDTQISAKSAEIKTTTDSISSRVSATETTLNASGIGLVSRMSSVEQNITASAICTKISTAVSGGTSSISTIYFTMDNAGLTVKNGGIKVLNNANTQIFGVGTDGYLDLRGTFAQYNSDGKKSVEIKNNALKIYNYKSTNNELVGGFANINDFTNTSGNSGIALYGTRGHALTIGMKRDNAITKYIACVDNGDGSTDRRIDVQMDTYFRNWGAVFCGYDKDTGSDFTVLGKIKVNMGSSTGMCIGGSKVHIATGIDNNFGTGIDVDSDEVTIWHDTTIFGKVAIGGELWVNGKKIA